MTTNATSCTSYSVNTAFTPTATTRDGGKSLIHNGWQITTHKYPICNSGEIETMTQALGIAPPEMIFGNNCVSITHLASRWNITFIAFDALDVVDKTGKAGMLKVSYSDAWQRVREKVSDDIRDVVRPFDWSYSTNWRGKILPTGPEAELLLIADDNNENNESAQIPFEKLRRPDPILLFDDVVLYEDELADNGIAVLSVKIRVMPERLLVLQRFFLRLDGVVVRIRDTRVYIDFTTGEVIREYVSREEKYADVSKKFSMYPSDDIPSLMRDPNKLVDLLPVVEIIRERGFVR